MDLKLNITGNSSSARSEMSALGETIKKMDDATGLSMATLAKGALAAGAAVAAFAAISLKAYADSERTLRQLQRAAGDYTGTIDAQSKALSRLYAVDDDIINQSATLLAQWGGAAAASKQAEVAALNLASAMGTDLNTATHDLIRNVESGGIGLSKMGIHFKVTGDKGQDLAAAVAAINAKLGGAAAADANSLTGQLHAANLAFEDIQKSIGGSVAAFLKQSGAVEKLAAGLRSINDLMTPTADKQAEDPAFIAQQVEFWDGIASGNIEGWKDAEAGIKFTFEEAQAELAKWRAKLNPQNFNAAFAGTGGVTGTTNKGLKNAAAGAKGKSQAELDDASLANAKAFQDSLDAIDEHAAERDAGEQARMWGLVEEEEKARDERAASGLAFDKRMAKEADDRQLAQEKDEAQAQDRALKDSQDRTAKKAREAQAAGEAIGVAFVNALSDQLSKLAAGEEFDVAIFVGDILASVIAVAGTVIGTAYGQPALGAAVGNLAAQGIRAGGSAISKSSKSNKPRTFHDGGWIGDDERVITAQTGEFMMSRAMVQNAGGRGAVEQIAKGRGGGAGLTINLTAIDTKSVADTFSGPGADGLKQALKRGHGALPSLLQRNPR